MSFPLDKAVKVRKWLGYTNIIIDLHKTPYCLSPEGQKALFRLIYTYITSHRNSERVSRQSFAFGPDIIAFTVLTKDLEKIRKAIRQILTKPESLTENKLEKASRFSPKPNGSSPLGGEVTAETFGA